jgi:hypothetical protein
MRSGNIPAAAHWLPLSYVLSIGSWGFSIGRGLKIRQTRFSWLSTDDAAADASDGGSGATGDVAEFVRCHGLVLLL